MPNSTGYIAPRIKGVDVSPVSGATKLNSISFVNPNSGSSPSAAQKFSGFMGNYGGAIAGGLNTVANVFDAGTDEGKHGEVTQAANSTYDAAMEMAGNFGPWGKVVQAGMAANKLISNIGYKYIPNAKTDGLTAADSFMQSAWLGPIGWINGLTGANLDTVTKNQEAFSLVGSSYTGSNAVLDEAADLSGKRLGGVSMGKYDDFNNLIAEARRQNDIITDIADTSTTRTNLVSSMSGINNNRTALKMQGGVRQQNMRVAKNGLKISPILIRQSLQAHYFKNGGKQEKIEKPIEESIKQTIDINSIYNSIFEDGFNTITEKENDIETYIELAYPVEIFQKGGSINIIPEGALHARKHNMDIKGITKKGIPVVSEDEEGNIEQHAEIERSEVILRLEVTEKLEELCKKYQEKQDDELALEAGKLLTEELLYNTVDNTKELI